MFLATIVGLVAGLGVGKITEYYTGTGTKPVKSIVDQSVTGAATNIIAGLGVGMMSTAIPILLIAAAIILSFSFCWIIWNCYRGSWYACKYRYSVSSRRIWSYL